MGISLYEANGKEVKVTMRDGQVFVGRAYDYISAYDNDPDPESITMPPGYELFAPEIEKIELL